MRRTSAVIGAPFQWTEPPFGPRTPISIRMMVVLPAPLAPTKPVTRPGTTENETSSTTVVSPKTRVSERDSSMPPR